MKNNNKIKIAILMGGRSVEHDISLISALQCVLSVDKDIYEVYPVFISKSNYLFLIKDFENIKDCNIYNDKTKSDVLFKKEEDNIYLVHRKKKHKIDAIFPIVHGKGVEDGCIAGYLKFLNIPTPIPDLYSSVIFQDKDFTKKILKELKINVIQPIKVFLKKDYIMYLNDNTLFKINDKAYPLIIKPSTLGSSIGINIAKNEEELYKYLNEAFKYDDKVIIEKCLTSFREFNIAGYAKEKGIVISSIEEICNHNTMLTFDDKYQDGAFSQVEKPYRALPAILPKEIKEMMEDIFINIYNYFNLKGVIRIDFLYDLKKEKLYVNEINTIPGSLAFYLFKPLGISYKMLFNDLIKEAFRYQNEQRSKIETIYVNSDSFNKTLKK